MAQESDSPSAFCTRLRGYLRDSPFFCKIIELVFCVISLGLIIDPINNGINMMSDNNCKGLVYLALCGYIMINAIVIVCYLCGEKMVKNMAMCFTTLGALLCLGAGVVILHNYDTYDRNMLGPNIDQYLDQMLASGIFAILASAAFAVDIYLTNKYEES
ncbi:uncharacterized protein LOC107039689 [Diachasma alloeum]|uniref:uncharacterized protein LOC107039689 n=1 Tax=Diachasma alloeum TaxID=454923 RepID=UPI000738454C|nr:uncharacterized protein LOC107039689 [Diachasma alloeum]